MWINRDRSSSTNLFHFGLQMIDDSKYDKMYFIIHLDGIEVCRKFKDEERYETIWRGKFEVLNTISNFSED